MSILIKGMAMPKSCFVCPLKAEVEFDEICSQTGEYVCQYDRADDCPLVPVPKHGRLIDADALLKGCERVATEYATREYAFSQSAIENAPTIIPAEEETE